MASKLRQVLTLFEESDRLLSLREMARQLDVEPSVLDGMIGYWVQKGRLREVSDVECGTCAIQHGCPLMTIKAPRRYELVTGEAERETSACTCCR